jgi:hypothetical protein
MIINHKAAIKRREKVMLHTQILSILNDEWEWVSERNERKKESWIWKQTKARLLKPVGIDDKNEQG